MENPTISNQICSGLDLLCQMDQREGLAAWASAIAATVALTLALIQGWIALQRDRQREVTAGFAAAAVIGDANTVAVKMVGQLERARWQGSSAVETSAARMLESDQLKSIIQALLGFDLSSLPCREMMHHVMSARQCALEFRASLESLASVNGAYEMVALSSSATVLGHLQSWVWEIADEQRKLLPVRVVKRMLRHRRQQKAEVAGSSEGLTEGV